MDSVHTLRRSFYQEVEKRNFAGAIGFLRKINARRNKSAFYSHTSDVVVYQVPANARYGAKYPSTEVVRVPPIVWVTQYLNRYPPRTIKDHGLLLLGDVVRNTPTSFYRSEVASDFDLVLFKTPMIAAVIYCNFSEEVLRVAPPARLTMWFALLNAGCQDKIPIRVLNAIMVEVLKKHPQVALMRPQGPGRGHRTTLGVYLEHCRGGPDVEVVKAIVQAGDRCGDPVFDPEGEGWVMRFASRSQRLDVIRVVASALPMKDRQEVIDQAREEIEAYKDIVGNEQYVAYLRQEISIMLNP